MNIHRESRLTFLGLLTAFLVLLSGCATTVPEPIREAPAQDVSLRQVLSSPQQYQGTTVRWGGQVLSVENRAEDTLIAIIARELEGDGRPKPNSASLGRFIAVIPGFVEPTEYDKGDLITVVGEVAGVMQRQVGEYTYPYPVVRTDNYYEWEPIPDRSYYYYDPFWYDPWYPYFYPYPYPFQWRYNPYWW